MPIRQSSIRTAVAVCLLIPVCSVRVPAQSEPARPAFEVTSVRLHKGLEIRSGPLTVSSRLITMRGYTIFGLVMDAWHLKDYQLAFGKVARPEDIYDTMYDISATAPGPDVPGIEQTRAMLQALLLDRFRLKVHHETKEMPVYALVLSTKNGPRLKLSSGKECSVRLALATDGRNNEETFSGCSIERLADRLTNLLGDRPVVDHTGLAGIYDFRLVALPEYRNRNPNPADVSAFTAVGDLGLRLVSQREKINILAVDHFEKPSPN